MGHTAANLGARNLGARTKEPQVYLFCRFPLFDWYHNITESVEMWFSEHFHLTFVVTKHTFRLYNDSTTFYRGNNKYSVRRDSPNGTIGNFTKGTIGNQRTLNFSRQLMVPLVPMVSLVETLVPMVPLVVPMVPLVCPMLIIITTSFYFYAYISVYSINF